MIQETVVGLDVHADFIMAAILPPKSDTSEVVKLSSDLMQVRRLFRRLSAEGPVRSCYEASGAGFVLQRLLTYDGFSCHLSGQMQLIGVTVDPGETHQHHSSIHAVNLEMGR